MQQTITQKIIAEHCKRKYVPVDTFVEPKVDIALSNDITTPLAIQQFKKIGKKKLFSRDRCIIVLDHFVPNKDIQSAEQCRFIRDFVHKNRIKYFFDGATTGIEHVLLPEQGLVAPGDLVIGADSHTCTYGSLGAFATGVGSTDLAVVWSTGHIWLKVPRSIKFVYTGKLNKWVSGKDIILYTIGLIGVAGANYRAMEFTGEVIKKMPMHDRFTMCNMSVEAGAKNGIIEPDEITLRYIRGRIKRKFKLYKSDKNAHYEKVIEIDCSKIVPQVASPSLPSNTKPVEKVGRVLLDQVVIGSCTNGWLEDLRIVASILKNKKIHPYVRTIIFPSTPYIYLQALKEGLIEIFVKAGAIVALPTCGPCLGGHLGILGKGEKCLSTTNRNFAGRMGHPESEVYLCSPAVAAASAIKGYITLPEN